MFAQRLRGTAKPSAVDGNMLAVASVADGVPIPPVWAGGAIFESELVLTGATTFQQTEWLALGADGSRLSIGTVGSSNLGHGTVAESRLAAVLRRVEEGEGRLAGRAG